MIANPEVGKQVSYHLHGWRVGLIAAIPTKGQHKGDMQIEQPALLKGKPCVKVWVPAHDVNEVGDTIYQGPRLDELVRERAEAKREEQQAAEVKRRKMSAKMFRRGD